MKMFKAIDLVYMAVGAVLIAVCSWISIPTTVPFTLQTFAVFLVLSLLGGKKGTISVIVYILLGLAGVPVFAGFSGGAAVLFGTTGGYIIGFIFMGIIYWVAEVLCLGKDREGKYRLTKKKRVVASVITMVIGLIICYAFGTAWFMIVYAGKSGAIGLGTALAWCVIPFVIPDLAKMAVALFAAGRLKKLLHL